jgi:hypothetical protein
MDAEQHSGDPASGQAAANFPKPLPAGYCSTGRHSNRPAELYRLNIGTDYPSIFGRQAQKPIPHRHRAGIGLVKPDRQALRGNIPHLVIVSFLVRHGNKDVG